MNCVYCSKPLRTYKVWRDWVSRNSHYSCWKEKDDQMKAQIGYEQYLEEVKNEKKE